MLKRENFHSFFVLCRVHVLYRFVASSTRGRGAGAPVAGNSNCVVLKMFQKGKIPM